MIILKKINFTILLLALIAKIHLRNILKEKGVNKIVFL